MTQLVWRVVIHTDDLGSIPSMPSELSLLHRACLVQFTSPMWFAGYYTVGSLPSAHKVLTRRLEAVTEVVAAVGYILGSKKNIIQHK